MTLRICIIYKLITAIESRKNRYFPLIAILFLFTTLAATQAAALETEKEGANTASDPMACTNLLTNPGFEINNQGEWFDFSKRNPKAWGTFRIVEDKALTGQHSLYLELDSTKHQHYTQIVGAIQNVPAEIMPQTLSGAYRVEEWQRGAQLQYLQVVLIVWNTQKVPEGIAVPNYQIAYVLAGAKQPPPLQIINRRFLFAHGKNTAYDPEQGVWKTFELPVRQDFIETWGIDPAEFEYIRVLFEVRYDYRPENAPRAKAKVWYDDLYFGSEPEPKSCKSNPQSQINQ